MSKLTHISPTGGANMVDVSLKAGARPVTAAEAQVSIQPATYAELD